MILFLCFFIFISLWVWSKWHLLVTYWKVGAAYPALPFLGQAYLLGNRERSLKLMYRAGEHAIRNGGHSSGWILDRFYLVIADAMDAEYIMKHHLEKCEMMSVLRIFTRSSLLFTPVIQWRPHRKIVSALLSHKNVNKFEPVFAKSSETLVQQLRPLAGKGPFSIWQHFSDYSVETTCNTVLGIDLNSVANKQYLKKTLNDIMDLAAMFVIFFLLHIDGLMKKTRLYGNFEKCDKFIKSCVDMALEQHEKVALNDSESETPEGEEQFSSLLHMFVRLKKQRGMDYTMLHDETLGLLIASSDTTAITVSIVAIVLARKPDVQEKIYLELKEVFGDSDRAVTVEDLPRLKYMEAAIKEIMRLYPPVPHITRKVMVDTTLPSGLTISKGTNIVFSIYALHRNPKYWGADADQFRPERFLDGTSAQTTFFAFSHGPRGCPGNQYAMMSMKTALATLLRQYRVLPATACEAPPRFLFGVTVKATDDFQVRIEERNKF